MFYLQLLSIISSTFTIVSTFVQLEGTNKAIQDVSHDFFIMRFIFI
jgi:hypothetical protein